MMEKIIKIDGQDVGFKAPASLPVRYRNMTGRDLFVDMQLVGESVEEDAKPKSILKKKTEEKSFRLSRDCDTTILYNIVHVMARIYDVSVLPDLSDWLDTFIIFPIFQVFAELQPLLTESMSTTKK